MNPLRATAVALRRMRDRALHPGRTKRALRLLESRPVRRVVVMCQGNICRSPFAAAVLQRALADWGRNDISIVSAGIVGPNRPTPPHGVGAAAERGIDLSQHRSTLVTAATLQAADLVIVMSAEHASDIRWRGAPSSTPVLVLGDLDPNQIDERTIRDPWNCDEQVFRDSYGRIERCVQQLAAAIMR